MNLLSGDTVTSNLTSYFTKLIANGKIQRFVVVLFLLFFFLLLFSSKEGIEVLNYYTNVYMLSNLKGSFKSLNTVVCMFSQLFFVNFYLCFFSPCIILESRARDLSHGTNLCTLPISRLLYEHKEYFHHSLMLFCPNNFRKMNTPASKQLC